MKHILIVEDDLYVGWLLPRALAEMGYRVSTAGDGVQALEALKDAIPDLILSDMQMPNMDGWTLFQEVRDLYPDIPFVAMSGGLLCPDASSTAFDGYLTKPFRLQDLFDTISTVFQNTSPPETTGKHTRGEASGIALYNN